MTSFKTPTKQQIDTAVQRMRSPEFAAYFFARLENPKWVTALNEKGLFATPLPPFPMEGGVSFPHWPASKYLARMAKYVPSEVASIFAEFKTDNVFVIGDMLDAAIAMPTEIAVTLVPVISQVAQAGTLWVQFKGASDLCVCLADGGEVRGAMTLAEALFTPRFEEGQEQPSRQDEYWYKDGLKKVVPVLVGLESKGFLVRVCEWLKASVDAKKHVDPHSGSDYSYTWRPAVEEHGQNRTHDFAGAMVGFVRKGFEQAIRDGKMSLEEAIDTVERYQYLIFKRIRIHLINEFAERNVELARRVMMDHDLFDDYQYKHEYAMLVSHRLDLLTVEERDTWFGWIDAGPDMSDFDESLKENLGRDATDEDRQNRRHYWQFKKLHCVRKHLEGDRLAFYENMLAKHGKPELADLNSRISSGYWGNTSPMTIDDFAELTFEQTVETVSTWEPAKRQFKEPNVEGLAETFGEYVGTDPEVFSVQASVLIGRPAIYVRGFINQMAEGIKTGREIDVPAVLKLCRWVLERPLEERTTPEQGHDVLVDKDWQWTRDQISQFVKNICEAKAESGPKYPLEGLREPIWQVMRELCRDRAETYIVHEISEDDPRVHDYLTLSINSPRGKAIEAGLQYARWVANHIKKADGKREVIPGGFEAMPEVREMLEWHIDPDHQSVEALAMIGLHMDLIYWIDKDWLASNLNRLFNVTESPPMAHGWAAWNAFLVWVRPHLEFYRLFKDQFACAVEQSAHVKLTERSLDQPMNYLGEHLMVLYWRGQLGLDDDNGLLKSFLNDSNPDIRRHAIDFAGRSLQDKEKLPEEVVVRFKILWETYWAGPGKEDAQQKPGAWLFGIWFSSGQLPEQWALEQLERFVEVTPTPEPDHAVAKQLAKIASTDIVRAVRILDRMVRGDREGWRIHGWLDSARQILEVAMKAGDDGRRQAERLIDYLGRRGHTSFGELLNVTPSQPL